MNFLHAEKAGRQRISEILELLSPLLRELESGVDDPRLSPVQVDSFQDFS